MLLANRHPDWEVVLVHHELLRLEGAPCNLTQQVYPDALAFVENVAPAVDTVVLCLATLLESVSSAALDRLGVPWIAWSRHPFDSRVRRLASSRSRAHVVCVGEYQWYSNAIASLPVHFIQQIFVLPPGEANVVGRPPRKLASRVVHMSSLTRWKGFLGIARQWDALKSTLSGVSMDVIGGSWGAHPLIPASVDFASELLRYIPEQDIRDGRVVFHGNLGEEKNEVIRSCDFALLNPTGESEAFPATPVECMWLGVPVIASDDYGMADSMRWFPELSIRHESELVDRSAWLLADADRFRVLQARSVAVANALAANADESLSRWSLLLHALASGRLPSTSLRPLQPRHGSLGRLIYRREIRWRLGAIKRRLAGRGAK
jgi:glycosyltransferase involved in cell wall biosynthesis